MAEIEDKRDCCQALLHRIESIAREYLETLLERKHDPSLPIVRPPSFRQTCAHPLYA
jgi:hypothetical protein